MTKLEELKEAQKRMESVINATPCNYSAAYSNITGGEIFLKLENLQRTGSFKVRGAYNKICSIKQKNASVIASSSANHARGVAFSASKCKRNATIVLPKTTPLEKTLPIKNYGAEVILEGENFDESYIYTQELQERDKLHFIHPFDDPKVITGYGTIALEMLEAQPDLQAIVVPVGGGGLISGISIAAKLINPDIKIIGVQTSGSNAMKLSLDKGAIYEIEQPNTFADAVATRQICKRTYSTIKKYVDEIVVVEDEEIASVILMLLERSKLMAEGAGAMALTAALYGKVSLHGMKTGLVISGGNIDMNFLAGIIERGLVKEGRMAHIIVDLPDVPGALSMLTGIIGSSEVNILDIKQQSGSTELPFGQTKMDLKLEVNGFEQVDNLLKELKSKGYELEVKPS